MTKRGIIGIVTAIFLIIAGVIIWQSWCYHNPRLELRYKESGIGTVPFIIVQERSLFGYSADRAQDMNEWTTNTNQMEYTFATQYEKPFEITGIVTIENGRTIVTYSGTATRGGASIPVGERLEFDFVLTDELPDPPQS